MVSAHLHSFYKPQALTMQINLFLFCTRSNSIFMCVTCDFPVGHFEHRVCYLTEVLTTLLFYQRLHSHFNTNIFKNVLNDFYRIYYSISQNKTE